MSHDKRDLLRHTLATVAYRGRKVVVDVPDMFPAFRSGESSRTPVEILAHIGDLFDWALSLARGGHVWHDSRPQRWDLEVARFFESIRAFDDCLASEQRLATSPEQLFQGPVADALTHLGQMAMLRRLAGAPIRRENYYKAEIVAGRVGLELPPPWRES